ncbi:MAG TPA: UDP-glucose/GDP-mannose dehydrogenase family protein [Candidatus Norongarragalinales archaeon]|nr:UDP-glucose/GDP-mannose dehydrogenase family protein [Candidatus Norongarragalinales archaeon]
MKLGFVGAGYVGLVSASGYAKRGHSCTCVDIDGRKVDQINRGHPPIYEKGLETLLPGLVREGKLAASSSFSSLADVDMILICVGTPSGTDGSVNLDFARDAAARIGEILRAAEGYKVIIVKSTVIPGSTSGVIAPILEKESGKKAGEDFGIAMIPEFLKEGTALEDFENPDRIIIGCEDGAAFEQLRKLHSDFKSPILHVPISTAEMIKYASNSFLATKISFINQLANLCDRLGMDVDLVAKGMGMDRRIGPHFLKAGPGFGGSCLPKDVKALMHYSSSKGLEPTLLEAVMEINYLQPMRMIELASAELSLSGKKVAVLGLAFKAGTDDTRESPAITLVGELVRMGCNVVAYDPKGMDNFRRLFHNIAYSKTMEEAINGADACFIVTDWQEFKKPLEYFEKHMAFPLVIDSRRILEREGGKGKAVYKAIGRGAT